MFENLEKYPCYGMLEFHRTSGRASPSLGSSIQHKDAIKTWRDLKMSSLSIWII